MKKHFIIALCALLFSVTLTAQSKQAIPKEYVGHWQKGTFSLTSFEDYQGRYVGPANEMSVSYVIEANGIAKEYFISNTNTYNCRMQILGYREGKIVMNISESNFEFQPTTGYYHSLTCMSKTSTKKPYGEKDLYPNYRVKCRLEKDETGMPVLVTKNANGTSGLRLKKIG